MEAPSGGSLLSHVSALPLPRREGKAPLVVVVEVDGDRLLENFEGDRMEIEIYVYALRPGGAVAAFLAQRVEVEITELGEALFDSGLKFNGLLELDAGSYDVRVAVKRGQAFGLASQAVTVAETPDDVPLPILADPEARDAWVGVRQWKRRGRQSTVGQLLVDERPVHPSAHPILVAGRPGSLYVLSTAALPSSGRCLIELVAKGRDAVQVSAPCEIEPMLAPLERASLLASRVRFELPRMDAGELSLRVSTTSGDQRPIRSRSTPVLVLDSSTWERELLWTDLRFTDPVEDVVEEPESSRKRKQRRGLRRLGASYEAVLLALLAEGENAAKRAVLEMESEALSEASGNAFRQLARAERLVAEALAQADAETLVPLLALHTDLYRTYVDRRVFSLAAHSKEMVSSLVRIYVENGGATEVASRALTSLGSYLQDANLRAGSTSLFSNALELNPQEAAALIGLAAMLEKFSDLQGSAQSLRELVAFAPDDGEALLRLGIDLCRSGRGRQGRQVLRDLLETPASLWILRLTYEGLASSLLDEGRLGDALTVLLDGVEILPEAQRPYLLTALVFDRLGRPHESIDMVRRYSVRRLPTTASPRLIYDSWPKEGVEVLRAQLAVLASDNRPRLATALADLEY